ncbi:MAG: murein transglycosylase A [Rhodospirillaceae bacterium]|nr:murein transglycosylase A [Rhodospirillaceae bacterium]
MQRYRGGFMRFTRWLVVLGALILSACTPSVDIGARPDALTLSPVAFTDLPGWGDGRQKGALTALRRSCAKTTMATRPQKWPNDALPTDSSRMCAAAKVLDDVLGEAADNAAAHEQARIFFETWFQAYRAANHEKTEGLFTGYFEAELKGSRSPGPDYLTPLYRLPDDHVTVDLGAFDPALASRRIVGKVEDGKLKPYFERAAIDSGALIGQELFWVSDPIDAFVLHVQGSGRIVLPDGSVARVGFAGHNGHAYRSIGRTLIDRGALRPGQASWPDIRAWIDANPDQARALFAVNQRYIFFRERFSSGAGDEGPIGAQGVPLTPERSLAVDRRFIPLGVPVWLDTIWPATDQPLRRLMVAQDSGSAIRGPVRGDFFWGYGAAALAQAGRMKSSGEYYILIPRTPAGTF